MEIDFINKIIHTTLMLAILCLCLFNGSVGLGIAVGAGWGCANLILIKHVVQNWLKIERQNYWKRYLLLWIKFPLLYVTGYVLLKSAYFSIESLTVGFSLLSLAIVLRGLKTYKAIRHG